MISTATPGTLLEARGIVKDFPGQRALDGVDFDVRYGEVHALIGENGAGKSTLVKIIAGLYHADQGQILVDGNRIHIASPRDSQALGLAFIHQELNIVPYLSVAENIFLDRYPRNRLGLVSLDKMVKMAQNISDALDIGVNLRTPAQSLSVINQWKMIINRALAQKPRVIFMDEPTGSLTYTEVDDLFRSIKHLKDSGTAIVYISHRMEEIFKIADRVTVIKDARKVGTADIANMDTDKIYQMMLGRNLKDIFPEKILSLDEFCLEVKNLSRLPAINNVSFKLRRGEVLGIAGLVGSGRTELVRLLFGADRKDSGEIIVDGRKVDINSPKDAIRHKIALVPEERRRDAVIMEMDIKKNITLASLEKLLRWPKLMLLKKSKERYIAQQFVDATDIKSPGLNKAVEYLSGGNQQKVAISKWLCSEANILIFDEPTRGIDVGAKFAIYNLIADLARKGKAIIIISSDLVEVVGMAHNILVMTRGEIKAEFRGDEKNVGELLDFCMTKEVVEFVERK
jgi:ribose transport system ATP-binding protein